MNIEIMAWSTVIAGLVTFLTVKALSWLPFSIRLFIWFLGVALMGIAMVYLANAYDPKMLREVAQVAFWVMMAARIAVPILGLYIIAKWGHRGISILISYHTESA